MDRKTRIANWVPKRLVAAILSVACGGASLSSANADSASGKKEPARPWAVVKVELPASDAPFPAGVGRDVASSQCLICHSAAMVLTQPPLKKEEWRAEIMKMRSVYGAPIPDSDVEGLAEYLKSINGRE